MSNASKMHFYLASLGRSQWVNLGRKYFDGFLGDFNDSLILSPSVPAKAKCKVSPTTRLIALLLSFDEAREKGNTVQWILLLASFLSWWFSTDFRVLSPWSLFLLYFRTSYFLQIDDKDKRNRIYLKSA